MDAENPVTETIGNEMATPKIKHDWYQAGSHVFVIILAKNSEDVKVSYTETTLSVYAKLPSGSDYNLKLDLAHRIIPDQCLHKVVPSKIEIKLEKADFITWESLEKSLSEQNIVQPIPAELCEATSKSLKYPSSSKKWRDWDKVEKDIEKQEANEQLEGDEAVNALFRKIYVSGSDEVRRAMNKSYQESAGTVLSTNWSEVGNGKVDRKAPNGMEWKTWDS